MLTTYSVLASEYLPSGAAAKRSFDQDCLSPMHSIVWRRVVLDEAHVVSNRLTQQSRAVLALKASARWVVTGTPIQNRIEDLYPLMAFLKIHPLDDFHWFTRWVPRRPEMKCIHPFTVYGWMHPLGDMHWLTRRCPPSTNPNSKTLQAAAQVPS